MPHFNKDFIDFSNQENGSVEFYIKENGGYHFSWFGNFDFIRDH